MKSTNRNITKQKCIFFSFSLVTVLAFCFYSIAVGRWDHSNIIIDTFFPAHDADFSFDLGNSDKIPRVIHQTIINKTDIPDDIMAAISSWQHLNPTYLHILYDDHDIKTFVNNSFPELMSLFTSFHTEVERTDLFRYLVLYKLGGIYADSDTVCVRSINNWLHNKTSKVIVGLEANVSEQDKRRFRLAYEIQFIQWTIASVANHPLLGEMSHLIHEHIKQESKNDSNKYMGIIHRTGPGIWTKAMHNWLHKYNLKPQDIVKGHNDVGGGVGILNINGFGAGQPHSGSKRLSDTNKTDILAYHLFKGRWKKILNKVEKKGEL